MNKNQRRTLLAIAALIVVMFLYPPFQAVLPHGVIHNMGYQWIFHDPPMRGFIPAVVNVQMLLVQLMGTLFVGGLVFFLVKNQSPTRKRTREDVRADTTEHRPLDDLTRAQTDSRSDAGARQQDLTAKIPHPQKARRLTSYQKMIFTVSGGLLIFGCAFTLLTSHSNAPYEAPKNVAGGLMFWSAVYFASLWKARGQRPWIGAIIGIIASCLFFLLQGLVSGNAKTSKPDHALAHIDGKPSEPTMSKESDSLDRAPRSLTSLAKEEDCTGRPTAVQGTGLYRCPTRAGVHYFNMPVSGDRDPRPLRSFSFEDAATTHAASKADR